MGIPRRIRLVAGAGAVAMALPAAAAASDSDTTEVTLEVTSSHSGLSIQVEGDPVPLDSADLGWGDQTISGGLNPTTVTDARGSLTTEDWTVQVDADGDFSSGEDTIPLDGVSVSIGALGSVEAVVDGSLEGMLVSESSLDIGGNTLADGPYTLIAGETVGLLQLIDILGEDEAPAIRYTPGISVDVPVDTPAGTYTLTVLQSVS